MKKLIFTLLFVGNFFYSNGQGYKLISIDSTTMQEYYIISFKSKDTSINILSIKKTTNINGCWKFLNTGHYYDLSLQRVYHITVDGIGFPILTGQFRIDDKTIENVYYADQINGLLIKE